MSGDVTTNLIRALIDHMRRPNDEWASLAMVIELGKQRVRGTYGYLFSSDGESSATASRPSGIQPAMDAYAENYYKPDEAWPVKILVQFDRTLGKYEVTFEDSDASRWAVTPENIDHIAEELRPKFD